MTLEQFIQVVHAFKMSGTWVDLRETHSQFKAAGHVNAYDMSTGFVVPLTTGTGCSVSLLMNKKPLRAEVMISHAWAEDMDQVMHMFLKMLHEGALPKEKVLWFCVLVCIPDITMPSEVVHSCRLITNQKTVQVI